MNIVFDFHLLRQSKTARFAFTMDHYRISTNPVVNCGLIAQSLCISICVNLCRDEGCVLTRWDFCLSVGDLPQRTQQFVAS